MVKSNLKAEEITQLGSASANVTNAPNTHQQNDSNRLSDSVNAIDLKSIDNSDPMNAEPQPRSSVDGVESDSTDQQMEQLKKQLMDVQQDILILRRALADKIKLESEIKSKLGMSIMHDIQQDVNQTISDIKRSSLYRSATDGMKIASDKLTPSVDLVTESIRRQTNALKNSGFVKSVNEGLTNTWLTMKERVIGSQSTTANFNSFGSTNRTQQDAGVSSTSWRTRAPHATRAKPDQSGYELNNANLK